MAILGGTAYFNVATGSGTSAGSDARIPLPGNGGFLITASAEMTNTGSGPCWIRLILYVGTFGGFGLGNGGWISAGTYASNDTVAFFGRAPLSDQGNNFLAAFIRNETGVLQTVTVSWFVEQP